MKQTFVEFVVASAEEWTPEQKTNALRKLKHEPETLRDGLMENMADIGTVYCIRVGLKVRINDFSKTADEIIAGWQEMFKEELEKMV